MNWLLKMLKTQIVNNLNLSVTKTNDRVIVIVTFLGAVIFRREVKI